MPEAIDEFLAELAALTYVHFQWRIPAIRRTKWHWKANAVEIYNTADFASAAKRFKISVLSQPTC